MLYIGIDTGTHTGIAVWDSQCHSFRQIECVKIHEAMRMVEEYKRLAYEECQGLVVKIEDPRQRTWFGTEKMSREEERKRLQGVGSVKRDASIWDDFLSDLGVDYEMIAPKRNVTKLSHEAFVALTKYPGRTNEHKRDAAMLVFGR